MAYGVDIAAQRKAALDTLKFKKSQKARQIEQSTHVSTSTLSTADIQQLGPPPPLQSRDATVPSRYFPASSPSTGRILVPDSSPIGHRVTDRPYQSHGELANASPLQTPPHNNTWQHPVWRRAPDPLTAPTHFTASSEAINANFSRSSQLASRRIMSDDDDGAIEPPRKRINLGAPVSTSDNVDAIDIPTSPEVQRPGRKRRALYPQGSLQYSDSDDSIPEASSIVAGSSKPQSSGTFRPSVTVIAKPVEDQKLRGFLMTYPMDHPERVKAAYKACDGDTVRAAILLSDPAFIVPPAPPPSTSSPEIGRVKQIDEEREAARIAAREKARKSRIYSQRQILDKVTPAKISASTSSSTNINSSPVNSLIPPKRRSNLKNRIIDSGSEAEAEADDKEESDVEMVSQGNWTRSSKATSLESKALDGFNTHPADALRELTGCTAEQAEKIISLRPFESVEDLNSRLGQGRKKAGPAGISPRMFEDCIDIYRGYIEVDNILEDCERVGAELRTIIASWSKIGKGKGRENSSTPRPTSADDLFEEGALNLHDIPLVEGSNNFSIKSPSLMSPHVQLKDYQLLGVNWLNLLYSKRLSCILADEMGLGKTVQVISFLAYLKERGVKGPHLIVVPSSTLENWCREFDRFAPSISVQTYYAGKEERSNLRQGLLDSVRTRNKSGWEVLITTYNLANGDERDRKFFKKMDWHACIFDEGHVLKNFQSQRYAALTRIPSRWKLLLTGTPLQNNLQELVSLMNFILPAQFADAMEHLRAIFKVKGDSKVSLLAEGRISRAKKMMTPFVLRRRKDQVLKDMPKKTERIHWCDMTPSQKSIYRDALKRSRKTVFDVEESNGIQSATTNGKTKAPKKARPNPRSKEKLYLENSSNVLMDLRKAASHPMLFRTRFTDETLAAMTRLLLKEPDFRKRGAVFEYVKEDMEVMTDAELQAFCQTYKSTRKYLLDDNCYIDAGKIKVMLTLLDEYKAEGRRVLIFSQFTQILDILEVILKQRSIKYLVLTGSTAVDVRQGLVDEFSEDESIQVFLLSTKAGGLGINLTAASVVILFDQDFNPHNDRQAADRAYRIGQKRDVDIVKLITRGTIEEDMLRLAETKLALDEAVAGETEEDIKGESAPEKVMRISLMQTLRHKLDAEEDEGTPNGDVAEPKVIDLEESDLTDIED